MKNYIYPQFRSVKWLFPYKSIDEIKRIWEYSRSRLLEIEYPRTSLILKTKYCECTVTFILCDEIIVHTKWAVCTIYTRFSVTQKIYESRSFDCFQCQIYFQLKTTIAKDSLINLNHFRDKFWKEIKMIWYINLRWHKEPNKNIQCLFLLSLFTYCPPKHRVLM